jgi:plasmid maintenance system antidote protein VapI
MWLNLQTHYDLRMAQRTIRPKVKARIKVKAA